MMIPVLCQRHTQHLLSEARLLHFGQEQHAEYQPESEDAAKPEQTESTLNLSGESVDTDAPVLAAKAIEEAEKLRLKQFAEQRAALEKSGNLEKHADRPLTRVESARVAAGEFGETLLPFSTKTDNEYGQLHANPSEKQKAFTLKVAHAEKAEIERYIAAHKKEWDADQDVSDTQTMSIRKRTIMHRLARIEEIERYNPNRRLEALAWREKQRVASEKSEQEYQDTLESLWAAAPNERYPLPSGFNTFIKDFAAPLFQKTQSARRTFEATSNRSPLYEVHRDLYQTAKELERQRIDKNYAKWRDTPFEDAFRNRYAQLQDETSEFKRDLARVAEPMSEEQKIAEYLEFKEKGSSEKFRKRDRQGRILYSNLSDFERREYLRYKGSAQAKTITQWEFDKKYFHFAGLLSHEKKLPSLSQSVVAKLNSAIDSIAADIQEQPAVTPTISAKECSMSAYKICTELNVLILENTDTKNTDILKVFLNEMKKMGPQRITSITNTSFNIKDDDGAFRWYEFVALANGTFRIDNVNPVVEYKHVSDEEREVGRRHHIVYREPEEQVIDEEWQEFNQAGNVPLPESTPVNLADFAENQANIGPEDRNAKNYRKAVILENQANIGLKDIREIRNAENYRKAMTLQKAVRYFDDVHLYESMNHMPVPERHRRQVQSMIRYLNTMFRDNDNTVVNSLAGRDVLSVIDHMEKYLKNEKKNLIPDLAVPDDSFQETLTPEQEDEKIRSIESKSVNGSWVDAHTISYGSPGWKYKKGEGNRYYAKFGSALDICFYNGENAKWKDYTEAFIGKNPSAETLRMFKNLVRRGADRMWIKDNKDAEVSYHIDLDYGLFQKRVGTTEFFVFGKKQEWLKQ